MDVKCFQVLSHLHPGPKILVSPTSMYRLTSIQVPRFHQGPNIRASPPSRSCLTSIQGTSRLIQISIIASQPHHSPISPYLGLKMCIPSQSRSDLTHIHVSRICASPPYRHLDSRPQSINSTHHLNPGLFIFNSPPFIYCLIHFHPGPCICISPPSMARCACLPPPGCLSLPSMSRELYLTSIIVPSHHIQVSGCASQLNPGPFSTPSRSRRCVSHLHPGSEIHVSSSS